MSSEKIDFMHPPSEFYPVPFWSWNDRLKNSELVRQIREMKQAGLSGFFMHARIGLETPYLTGKWMTHIRTSVKEAALQGMSAWLYDEDTWPSGFAGGIVPRLGPEYRMKALVCSRKPQDGPEFERIHAYLLEKGTYKILNEAEIDRSASYDLLYCSLWTAPLGNPRFKNTSYVDLLNPKVVDAFLKSTHEAYASRFSDEFGRVIPGIFTDEPCYLYWPDAPKPAVPWTADFPDYFEAENGYNLLHHLPAIFEETVNSPKIRYDFWRTVTQRFVETFSKKVYRWCEAHKLQLVGHYMAEDTLRNQIRWIGAAMPHYEYMHLPGIDHLSRNIQNLITVKQASSAADQLGKPRTLSETYGCSGWNLTFEHQKWISEWQMALGINFINPHLSLYTARGDRKRDYPPSLHYQQPWWHDYALINTYLSRLSAFLTRGKRVVDLLVLHPIESAWTVFNPGDFTAVDRLNRSFVHISEMLASLHFDFHFGDESLIAGHGAVKDGGLRVGEFQYPVVLVPPAVTLRSTTIDLLQQFQETGGTLIFVGEKPSFVDGREDSGGRYGKLSEKAYFIPEDEETLEQALNTFITKEFRVLDEAGEEIRDIVVQHRKIDGQDAYFMANTSLVRTRRAIVRLMHSHEMVEWEPESNRLCRIESHFVGASQEIELVFEPTESHVLFGKGLAKTEPQINPVEPLRLKTPAAGMTFDAQWDFYPGTENAVTLDYCRYRIGRGEWHGRQPVIFLWKEWVQQGRRPFDPNESLQLEFSFFWGERPSGNKNYFMVIETPAAFEIEVNGRHVSNQDKGWWQDISFRKIPVPAQILKAGENRIVLTTTFSKRPEIESVYWIGDFEVSCKNNETFSLRSQSFRKPIGNLVDAGYPFFAGTVTYRQKFRVSEGQKKYTSVLTLPSIDAVVIKGSVNGKSLSTRGWRPFAWHISEMLQAGENILELDMTNSMRNLLGPHHHKNGELRRVEPSSFSDKKNWVDRYSFIPFGLTKPPAINFYEVKREFYIP